MSDKVNRYVPVNTFQNNSPAMTREECLTLLEEAKQQGDPSNSLILEVAIELFNQSVASEREHRRQLQAERIAVAKANNVKFGRRPKERPAEFAMYKQMWQEKNISANQAAKALGITHQTFLRWAREE